jgi:hypothetical protein
MYFSWTVFRSFIALAVLFNVQFVMSSRCITTSLGDGCYLTNVSSRERHVAVEDHIPVHFDVGCGFSKEYPEDYRLIMLEMTKPQYNVTVFDDFVSVGAPEPGTHLFNVSLINSTSNTLIDTHILCIDAVPAHWEAQLRAVSQRWQHKHGGYVPSREVWQHVRQLRGWQEAMGGEGVSEGDWPWEWGAGLSGEAVSDDSGDVRPISVLWVSVPCVARMSIAPW